MITTFENRCVLKNYPIVLIPIFKERTQGETCQKIHVSSISQIGPITTK